MTIPLWSLLVFAVWTLAVLAGTIGVYRWNLILRGERAIHTFRADATEGPDWYRRATRAHANCVENLPVFGAIVTIATFAGVHSAAFDAAAIVVSAARVVQTVTHIAFRESRRSVSIRFGFFAVQLSCMMGMAVMIASMAMAMGTPSSAWINGALVLEI